MDPIADKLSVNSLLIILSAYGYIHPVIPVIVVMRDMIVNTIRLFANTNGEVVPAGYTGKFKTAFLIALFSKRRSEIEALPANGS